MSTRTRSARPARPSPSPSSPPARPSRSSPAWRRIGYAANLALFLAAVVTIAVVAVDFARLPALRMTLDATKTRAYSLSEQTRQLLADLDGVWTIALILVEDNADSATLSQVDEVLHRYEEATGKLSVVRVDPTAPRSIARYETLLARLRDLESSEIDAYETALDDGVEAFEALQLFAQRQSAQLETAIGHLGPEDATRDAVQQHLALFGLLAEEGGQVLEAVADARRVGETQPLPDYETARSILAQALSQWADELYAMGRIYRDWAERGDTDPVLARYAATVMSAYEGNAQRLAVVADPLARLPVLEIATIGRQLRSGEALVILGPDRCAVVPSAQLFPKISHDAGDGAVAFDRRFRGEQVISAAIRSLLVEHMPMVVFVHADERSLLRQNEQHADLVGVATLLDASRFVVREWRVGEEPPVPESGQPAVWVVVPPSRRAGLEPNAEELKLIRTAERLIADGEPVLLNVYPSLLPRYRQADPWQRLAAPFGLRPETGRAVYEIVRNADGAEVYQHGQTVHAFAGGHPIGEAANGQQAYFPLPVPVRRLEDGPAVDVEVLAEVAPSPRRWLESDWARRMTQGAPDGRGEPFETPQPLVLAAERKHPAASGRQRFMLVGCGGWLLSYVADAATSIGGGRVALTNPGNQELLLASVAWLSGRDEIIAPSPVSRQVARLDGITRAAQWTWGMVTVIGAPLGCLLLGACVWLFRRLSRLFPGAPDRDELMRDPATPARAEHP